MTKIRPATDKPTKAPLRGPTPNEAASIERAKTRQASRPGRSSLTVNKVEGASVNISNPHTDGSGWWESVRENFGTTSDDFANDCLIKLSHTLQHCDGTGTQTSLNAALALIGGVSPEDELQAAIAVQIALAHVTSIHLTARGLRNYSAGHVETSAVLMGMATKASRTMVAHVEALAKIRGGGRQVIEHRYIQVNGNAVVGDGTQAVFGGITPEGGKSGSDRQAQGTTGLVGCGPAMLSAQSPGEALPTGGNAGTETVPKSRRKGHGRANGAG